jgi:hypothetical protein
MQMLVGNAITSRENTVAAEDSLLFVQGNFTGSPGFGSPD